MAKRLYVGSTCAISSYPLLSYFLQIAHVEPSQLTTSVHGVVLILLSHLRQTVNSSDPEQDGRTLIFVIIDFVCDGGYVCVPPICD